MSKLNNAKKLLINLFRIWVSNPLDKSPISHTDPSMGTYGLAFREIADRLTLAVQYAAHGRVDGDVAEFGVQSGQTAVVLANAIRAFCPSKTLHLFDSFEGLQMADNPVDRSTPDVQDGTWGPGQLVGVSTERLTKMVSPCRHKIHKGWFRDTIQGLAGTRLSVIHVDCDLYESAMDVLVGLNFLNLFRDGQVILFDDFNCNRSSDQYGERAAVKWFLSQFKSVSFEPLASYGWSGQSFIVRTNT